MGPALVFEPFAGAERLDAFLTAHPDLSADERFEILNQIVDVVDFCHREGVILRQLSPSAFLLRRRAKDQRLELRLYRFQSAAMAEHTQSSTTLYDKADEEELVYLAPEVLRGGQADTRSDLFSLGCLSYFLFTGLAPAVSLNEFQDIIKAGRLLPSAIRADLLDLDPAIAAATAERPQGPPRRALGVAPPAARGGHRPHPAQPSARSRSPRGQARRPLGRRPRARRDPGQRRQRQGLQGLARRQRLCPQGGPRRPQRRGPRGRGPGAAAPRPSSYCQARRQPALGGPPRAALELV